MTAIHFYGDVAATRPYQPCLFILEAGRYCARFSRRAFESYHEATAYGYRWVERWERRQWHKEQPKEIER